MILADLSKLYRDEGLVGAGGAGFPTYAKLNDKADVILLNCAECEPLLKLHRQLLALHTREILDAFDETRKACGASEGLICVKKAYVEACNAVKSVIGEYPNLRLAELASFYPAGDEVSLIYEATGRVVRPGGLPIEAGVIVFNVETMYNAHEAMNSRPVISKYVTVVCEVANPKTVKVPIGTPLSELVAMAGGLTTENPVYWVGGPMMGVIKGPSDVVTKTTNGLMILPHDHYLVKRHNSEIKVEMARAAASCCQCRMCTDLCPRNNLGHPIEPHKIMLAAACNSFSDVTPFLDTYFCCQCGICELYACTQGLSPRRLIGELKAGLRANGIKMPQVESGPVNRQRDYRMVPVNRLSARIDVEKYDAKALLEDETKKVSKVRIALSQHIGAPAVAQVKLGDKVDQGQVIASAANGLSVNIHASIKGVVTEVSDKFVSITAN